MRFTVKRSDLLALGGPVLAGLLLSSCASRQSVSREPNSSIIPLTADKGLLVTRTDRSKELNIVTLQNPSEEAQERPTSIPVVEPTRAEKIIRLVRSGGLIQADKNTLVFSRYRAVPKSSSSLYEDAVTLGRLRRQLKQVKSLPESVFASATIGDGKAFLTLDDGVPSEPAAEAIDAALKTDGVIAVHAKLFAPVRL